MTEFHLASAGYADIPRLLALCRRASAAPGSHWDDSYPNDDILRWDVDRGQLYRIQDGAGQEIGLISLGDLELRDLPWPDRQETAVEAARFCLDPGLQGQGLGGPAFLAAAEFCRGKGYRSLRFLVAADDKRLRRMYEKCGAVPLERQFLWGADYVQYLKYLSPSI